VRAGLRRVADAVLPPMSLDGRAAMEAGLSPEAWAKLVFLEAPVCDGCGAAFESHLAPVGLRCAACMAKPFAFSRARAACVYDEASRDLILKFKHADRVDLARTFSRWLGRAAAELLAEADAVAPVPLHPQRLIRRRYNQAAEIARPLARAAGLAYLPDALVRGRATDSQGEKSGAGRRRNVQGAFTVPEAGRRQIKGRRILLVDDVLTTGATAEACAKALLTAGARCVDLAVVARVPGRDEAPI